MPSARPAGALRIRPLSRRVTRRLSWIALAAWALTMAALVQKAYLQASPNLATDLARYGTEAQWRGVYYRGEKVGFTVGQVVPVDDGFELQEDGRLQMSLLGATTPAILKTTARVDRTFALRSFEFSLDPGTGPLTVSGQLDGLRLTLQIRSGAGTRTEVRDLKESPSLMVNLGRRLAGRRPEPTAPPISSWSSTRPRCANAPVAVRIGRREVVVTGGRPTPAFRAELSYAGISTTSWVTDTGEVSARRARWGCCRCASRRSRRVQLAVSSRVQADLLAAAAVVPTHARADRRAARRRAPAPASWTAWTPRRWPSTASASPGRTTCSSSSTRAASGPGRPIRERAEYLRPEPFIESDDPEIQAEARRMVADAQAPREQAERLVRGVNGLLDKTPTISVPSAREVLRTRVGDCNEHTALYVALARAVGIPTRINVGLAWVLGAFYYHAWPEVYLEEPDGRGLWLPVDPDFNQFPADATHVRLLRGGLDRQAAILPLIGKVKLAVLDVELSPDAVVRTAMPPPPAARPLSVPDAAPVAAADRRGHRRCWFAYCRGAR